MTSHGPIFKTIQERPATEIGWRAQAVCASREECDPEMFFPVGSSGPALLQIEQARNVCRRCPVVAHCLSWALESGQDFGVWGGMTEEERRAMKHRGIQIRIRPI